ncbi:hypothetical protein [Actinomadura rugatobispora]|uniref:WD40 repeat domain-containing protein n=1 Tax=Actinomadura rugatobispora TaxID=1994 RepID=A0ABW1A5B3_9ACTN|nr:hypothetical protein GCM10010200_049780 [Actinomadura rugatobispora]
MRPGRWAAARLVRRAADEGGPHLAALERRAGAGGPARALVVELATAERHLDHPLRAWSRDWIARAWARDRDPGLRAVVREHGLIAAGGGARWTTAALHGRLLARWDAEAGPAVPALLADADEEVCEGARRACADAVEPALGALWLEVEKSPGPEHKTLLDALLRNPHPLDDLTVAWAWSSWIRAPSPRLWAFLRDRGQAAPRSGGVPAWRLSRLALGTAPPEELCQGVLADGTPEHVRQIAVRICVERGLVPADPVVRAAFLLIVKRYGEYRAHDPDGTLLAAAYAGASAGLRARVRSAVAAAGELDLVRVLIGTAPARAMSVRERGFLADRLAAEQAWPELWRLARDLPLAEALNALRPVGGWCPPGLPPEEFARLRSMPPDRVAAALASLDVRGPVLPESGLRVSACALSPDGTRLAAAGRAEDAAVIVEYALPEREVIARHQVDPFDGRGTPVHTGDAVIVIEGSTESLTGRVIGKPVRYGGGGGERTILFGDTIQGLAAAPDGGLVAVGPDRLHLLAPPYQAPRRTVRFTDLGLASVAPFAVVVEWSTGMIALGGTEPAVLDAAAGTVIARGSAAPGRAVQVAFASPSRLVTVDTDGSVTGWRLADGTLRPERTVKHGRYGEGLAVLPGQGRVWAGQGTHFLDLSTLEKTGPPPGFPAKPHSVWAAPRGGHFAVQHRAHPSEEEYVEVHGTYRDSAGRMLDRPLGDAVPDDLARLDTLLASGRYAGDVAELLALLRILLEQRYGSEVALGAAVFLGDETDIAIRSR